MAEVTLSSKYQIVVPREAREALGLKPGAKLQVVVRGGIAKLFLTNHGRLPSFDDVEVLMLARSCPARDRIRLRVPTHP
ncbi:MAG: AbrB/MazE/SpoVT family DNA-binding domain-containing protein [Vicinamibacteria bacterium]|nr:AbrB/MazE/SpoVT family DNA-binding domain-containing protein [Vicinamibacteria bacterium]